MKTYYLVCFRVAVAFLFSFLFSFQSFSQPSNPKFGKITKEELSNSSFEQWPEAGAVVLFDIGKTWFDYNKEKGFEIKMERHTRIKILKSKALDWANVIIPFYETKKAKETVGAIKGSSFNLVNDQIQETKLEKSSIFEEKTDKYWRLKKISLPDVREGSIIEFSYEFSSDFLTSLPTWYFQRSIPVVWSEYTTVIPEYFNYSQFKQTSQKFDTEETSSQARNLTFTRMVDVSDNPSYYQQSKSQTGSIQYVEYTSHWIQRDIPAFENEPFIPTPNDYLGKIEFQLSGVNFPGQLYKNLIPTWEELVKELNEDSDFGGFANKNKGIKEIVNPLIQDLEGEIPKLNAIHQYVKTQFKWNENYNTYASQSIGDMLKTRTGNSAEINLYLVAMLKEAGLDANPVILSTRSNGKVNRFYPMLRKFNHVVASVEVGDALVLMDATDPEFSPEVLPFECLNGEGLLVGEQTYDWVPLTGAFRNIEFHSVKADFNGESLHCVVTTSQKGFGAVEMRKEIHNKGVDAACKTHLKQLLTDGQLLTGQFDHPEELSATLKGNMEFNTTAYLQLGGDLVYIEPMLGFGLSENPLKEPARTFEVDFGFPADEIYQFLMEVPEGYEVAEIPVPKRIVFGEAAIKFDFLVENTGTVVKVSYRYQRRQTVFTPGEYADLRIFFDHVAGTTKEPIVLHKKS